MGDAAGVAMPGLGAASVIPAQAGIHSAYGWRTSRIPANLVLYTAAI